MAYKRVLLKISGEQLSGTFNGGIDPKIANYFADEVKKATACGCDIAIVVGGGNLVRGESFAGNGIKRVTADQMGMLSGLINAIAITDIFEANGIKTRCVTNIVAPQVAESYSYRLAEKHLENKRVIIIAGGIARPYFTHDSAAVSLALELGCEVVLKATKVNGVYDKDPEQFADATQFEKLTHQGAIEDSKIKVMDKAALGLALEHNMPIIVFDAFKPGSLAACINGENVGTKITAA